MTQFTLDISDRWKSLNAFYRYSIHRLFNLFQDILLTNILTILFYKRYPQTSCITFILGNWIYLVVICYLLHIHCSLTMPPPPLSWEPEEVIETDGKITFRVCSLAITRMASNWIGSFLTHRLDTMQLLSRIFTERHNGEDSSVAAFSCPLLKWKCCFLCCICFVWHEIWETIVLQQQFYCAIAPYHQKMSMSECLGSGKDITLSIKTGPVRAGGLKL